MPYRLPAAEQIAAIVPSYSPCGDHSTIISTDGLTASVNNNVRTLIKQLARGSAIDLPALKARTAQVTNRTILQPLLLAPGLVLVPLKVRKPRVAGDTSTGYVNMHAVTEVERTDKTPYRSTLRLSGGTELPVLWSPATVNKQLQHARLAVSHLSLSPRLCDTPAGYAAITGIATKIIDLIYDLLNLKRSQ